MPDLPAPILSIRLLVSVAEVVLGLGEHVVGRSADCAVSIEDPLASRRHAVIVVAEDRVTIQDLGSRNGVLVNGADIDGRHTLSEGDLITLGSLAIAVREICRAGAAGAIERAARTAPLARIAVAKLAVPSMGTSTLGRTGGELSRPAAVYRLVAEAAARAVATDRRELAEQILDAPLLDVLTALRTGADVEPEILEIAGEQALFLAELTSKTRWVDYVRDLHERMRCPVPLDVADRLARLAPR